MKQRKRTHGSANRDGSLKVQKHVRPTPTSAPRIVLATGAKEAAPTTISVKPASFANRIWARGLAYLQISAFAGVPFAVVRTTRSRIAVLWMPPAAYVRLVPQTAAERAAAATAVGEVVAPSAVKDKPGAILTPIAPMDWCVV